MTHLTYGSHDPSTTPTTFLEDIKGRADAVEMPIPPGLIKQRRRINEIAAGTVRRIADRPPRDLPSRASRQDVGGGEAVGKPRIRDTTTTE